MHVSDQGPDAKACGISVDGAYDTPGDSSNSSGNWDDPVSEEERGRADGIQCGRRRSPGEAAIDQLVPALLGASPCQAFQSAAEVYGHPAWVFGVPQEDDVAKGTVQMAEAQRDPLHLTPAPRGRVTDDAQVSCVEAELGTDCQPAIENYAVLVQAAYGLDPGHVDEGGQEAVLQVAGSVALACEADD
ncbi:hypothetical protein ACQEWB_36475 [Streptomyces sp. CA-249302]|uniref:hypothetical protein n=1 Tax=Streptomyces sp. CA-249302 TaxID=3240058 RepID=UPI003D8B6111